LLQLTLLPLSAVADVMATHAEAPERRHGQRVLAHEVTALVHGAAEADRAVGASQDFTRGTADLTAGDWEDLSESLPVVDLPAAAVGTDLVELLVTNGALGSRSEGRRLIAQGGLYLNDVAVADGRTLAADDLYLGIWAMVRRGKKQRHVLRVT
jgi:tyrosyl-tRNA synthetase